MTYGQEAYNTLLDDFADLARAYFSLCEGGTNIDYGESIIKRQYEIMPDQYDLVIDCEDD